MMITPVFNLEKSLQVVLYIAKSLQRKDFHKIFKMLYFADREHYADYGRPITGDVYIAMKDGPVPSKIYDIFKAVRGDGFFANMATEYKKLFEVSGWDLIVPLVDADIRYLSKTDISILDSVLLKYGHLSWDEIRDKSHDYAWHSAPKDKRIAFEDILKERGENEDYINYLIDNPNA